MPEIKLKPCPFCGGEIEERGGLCNYGKKIFTLDLKCQKCETIFKSNIHDSPKLLGEEENENDSR